MAFSDIQRNQIMTYLGYPATSSDTRYSSYYPVWAQIDLLGSSPVTQVPIEALLTEIVAVDAVVAASGLTAARGAIKAVDEVEFFGPKESMVTIVDAPKRGRMLIKRLAQRCGGEHLIVADYFDTGVMSGSVATNLG